LFIVTNPGNDGNVEVPIRFDDDDDGGGGGGGGGNVGGSGNVGAAEPPVDGNGNVGSDGNELVRSIALYVLAVVHASQPIHQYESMSEPVNRIMI
jgi:hypothetical protein